MLLRHYLERGLSKRAIAQQLGISPRTIHHWIATGQLDRDLEAAPARKSAPRTQRLDRFRPLIQERLATYPKLSASRLFAECRAAGYEGGVTRLRDYVASIRPRPPVEPVIRFETEPGRQAQFDFAEVRFPSGKRFALLMVLGYSRVLHAEFVHRQTALTVMRGIERGFTSFGGVPDEILFDQMKAVIVEDHRPGGGRRLENAEFARFAAHWAFAFAPVARIARRRRGKWSGRSATCAPTSCTGGSFWATPISRISLRTGCAMSRMRGSMALRASAPMWLGAR